MGANYPSMIYTESDELTQLREINIMSLDSLGHFYTKLSEDPTLMEKLKQKYEELKEQPNHNPWYTEGTFFKALKILGEENGYNFTTDEVKKAIKALGVTFWCSGRALADGDGPPFISYFYEGNLDFAKAESRIKKWIELNNQDRQKYIQFAQAKGLTPEQEKVLLFRFLDHPYCEPSANELNMSVEEFRKVLNKLYERFGYDSEFGLQSFLEAKTKVFDTWGRILRQEQQQEKI
jgi:hypothetical protein